MKNHALYTVIVGFVATLLLAGLYSTARGDNPDPTLIRRIIEARNARLQNVVIEFDWDRTTATAHMADIPKEINLDNGAKLYAQVTFLPKHVKFCFLHGLERIESRLTANGLQSAKTLLAANEPPSEFELEIITVSQERIEKLYSRVGDARIMGDISTASQTLPWVTIDWGLGLRVKEEGNDWDKAASLDGMKFSTMDENGMVHAARVESNGDINEWTFDSHWGYAITAYVGISSNKKYGYEIICSDFTNVDGVAVPSKVTERHFKQSEQSRDTTFTIQLSNCQYKIGLDNNKKELYQMIWPLGCTVMDTRINKTIIIKSGDRTLDDDAIAESIKRRKAETELKRKEAAEKIEQILATQPSPATRP